MFNPLYIVYKPKEIEKPINGTIPEPLIMLSFRISKDGRVTVGGHSKLVDRIDNLKLHVPKRLRNDSHGKSYLSLKNPDEQEDFVKVFFRVDGRCTILKLDPNKYFWRTEETLKKQ